MSIVESREELDEARTRLAAMPAEQLATDLQYWSVACLDTSAEYIELVERQRLAQHRYREAQEWTTLIATELRSRRDARLADRPPAQD